MRKELYQEIAIPQGVSVTFDDEIINVKGPLGVNSKKINTYHLELEITPSTVRIGNDASTKRQKKMMNTIAAHIRNLISGVQEKFEYKLKVCFSHFPMTVEVKGNVATVKNFLGEKIPRTVQIPKGAEVEVNKEHITIKSIDKEIAGQAAANFEASTKVRGRDRRIFQDGIYITEKCGREI